MNKKKGKKSKLLLCYGMLGLAPFTLISCTSPVNFDYPVPSPTTQGALIGVAGGAAIGSLASGSGAGTIVGGVVGGAIGSAIGNSIERHQSLENQLTSHRVQLIVVGDKYKIIIPTDDYFFKDSPRLNPHYYPILNKVAQYMRGIPKTSVKVSAFSDSCGDQARNLALTREQARAMASYLWRQGIDTRMLYSAGYGANFPVSHNQIAEGRAQNRRIEITFWRIAPDDEF